MLKGFRRKLSSDSHLKELVTGSVVTFSLKMGGMALSYLLVYFISKKTGAGGVGLYSVVNQFLLVAGITGTWGTNVSVLRFVGQLNKTDEQGHLRSLYRSLLSIIIPISIVLGLIIVLLAPWLANVVFKNPTYDTALRLAGCLLPLFALSMLGVEFIRGLKRLKISEFVRSLARPLVMLTLLAFLWSWPLQAIDLIYLFAIAVLISALLSHAYLLRTLLPYPFQPWKEMSIKSILRISSPMMISSIVAALMGALPLFFIDFFDTTEEAGIYGLVTRLALIISLVLTVVNTIAAPKFSALFWNKEYVALQKLIDQSAKIMFWAALLLSIALVLLAYPLLHFFGQEFTQGENALIVLVIGQFINTATGSVGLLLNMSGHQSVLRNSALFSLLLQIILLFALLPTYGILGGAIASTAAGVIWNLICILYVQRKLKLRTWYLPFIS